MGGLKSIFSGPKIPDPPKPPKPVEEQEAVPGVDMSARRRAALSQRQTLLTSAAQQPLNQTLGGMR